MGKELALVEPIPVPDLSKGRTQYLPAWAERSRAALGTNLQMVQGAFRDVVTLPDGLLPNQAQRAAIEDHIRFLNSSFSETPAAGQAWAGKTAATAAKLLMTLGGDKRSEIAAEAKGEAYDMALEDLPWWAVEAAARSWYRGEAGNDEKGNPFDYRWPPDPATLRRLAQSQVFKIKGRINELQDILNAQAYVDSTIELENGRHAWRGLRMTISDTAKAESLTFMQAAEISRNARLPATAKSNGETGE